LLTHTGFAKQIASQGRAKIREKFSVEAMVDENIEIYQQILKTGR